MFTAGFSLEEMWYETDTICKILQLRKETLYLELRFPLLYEVNYPSAHEPCKLQLEQKEQQEKKVYILKKQFTLKEFLLNGNHQVSTDNLSYLLG